MTFANASLHGQISLLSIYSRVTSFGIVIVLISKQADAAKITSATRKMVMIESEIKLIDCMLRWSL